MPQFQSEESVFNMALAYLKRMDKLLSLCATYSMVGDIINWQNTLMVLYRELSIKLTDDEIKELQGNGTRKVNLMNPTKEEATIHNINLFCNSRRNLNLYRKQILFLLNHLEINIRKKMQKKGMLLPSKDDPMYAITKR